MRTLRAARPARAHTASQGLRLSQLVGPDRELGPERWHGSPKRSAPAWAEAERWGSHEPYAFATAVVRDAPNRDEIPRAVREQTQVPLQVLPGKVEAERIFLAARRLMGWRAGPPAVLDIGGG